MGIVTSSARNQKIWYGLDLIVAVEAREAVEYALMEASALGTETNDDSHGFVRVTGYFDQTPNRESIRAEMSQALRVYDQPSSSVREMNIREIADQDWLGEWKKSWQPVEVGERFIVAPPWADISDANNRLVIRIEPGMAFGTGTHETTRLCLAAIEKYFAGGSFLDVGTGTGILAIAAAKLFPDARIDACDTDAEAIAIAQENARLNGVAEGINFRVGTVEETTASVDLVCANLTADVIAPLLPLLVAATCRRLVLSGILETQFDMLVAPLQKAGVSDTIEIMQDGEWVAVIV